MAYRPKCIDEAMAILQTDPEIDDYLEYRYRDEYFEHPNRSRYDIFTDLIGEIEDAVGMWRHEIKRSLEEQDRKTEVNSEIVKADTEESRWLRRAKQLQRGNRN